MAYYSNPYNYNFGYLPFAQQVPIPMQMQQPMYVPQQNQMVEQTQANTMQMSSPPQPPAINDSYFIWVQGEAGAKSYPVARGTTLPLFDSEGDYVYFKSVDNNGVPLPLITKVLSDPPNNSKSEMLETSIQVDTSEYITKEKYDELQKKYSELENRILDLETKPSVGINSTFTGNTFNNSRKGNENGNK